MQLFTCRETRRGSDRWLDFAICDVIRVSRPGWRRGTGRSERIRTSDPLLPKQVRYQAALRSARPFRQRLVHSEEPLATRPPRLVSQRAKRRYSGHAHALQGRSARLAAGFSQQRQRREIRRTRVQRDAVAGRDATHYGAARLRTARAWFSTGARAIGASPSGKATDFDSVIPRFESWRPSQPLSF